MGEDAGSWGRWAIALVSIWLVADAAMAVAGLNTIAALGGFGSAVAPAATLAAADAFSGACGIAFIIAYILAGIAVLRWIYLTNRRAHRMSDASAITPGWAVGWFFVPVANLWKPFQGVRETWQVSVDPGDPASVETPTFLRWWWGSWLVSNALGNASFRLSMRADTPAKVIGATWINVWSFGVDCIVAVTIIHLIRRLTKLQDGWADTP